MYLQPNYGAQRVKKVAHRQQAIKNVEIKKGKISFVKKNYKGNLEVLKKHQDIPSYFRQNLSIKFDKSNPAEDALQTILKKNNDN